MKKTIYEEEIYDIDINDIGNWKDFCSKTFVHAGTLNKSTDGREIDRNINQKKKLDVLEAYRFLLRDKCCRWQYFFNKDVE